MPTPEQQKELDNKWRRALVWFVRQYNYIEGGNLKNFEGRIPPLTKEETDQVEADADLSDFIDG